MTHIDPNAATETAVEQERARFLAIAQELERQLDGLAAEKEMLTRDNLALRAKAGDLEKSVLALTIDLQKALEEKDAVKRERDGLHATNRQQEAQLKALKKQLTTIRATMLEWLDLAELMDDLSPFSAGYHHAKLEKQRLVRLTDALLRLTGQSRGAPTS